VTGQPEHPAQVVLPCEQPIAPTINFFTGLGFKVRTIVPADLPRVAVLQGHGLTIRLDADSSAPAAHLRVLIDLPALGEHAAPGTYTAPNGTVVELAAANPPLHVPPLVEEFVVTRAGDDFGEGRAGMLYRDLIPSRLGGRFIASHIWIPHGGPVPDYVHFHDIRFQMIFCHRGWTRVVYEDQGEPMLLEEGDCFLQPATIRHRVLESSDDLKVVEIGCPAEHETWGDPETTLPTGRVDPSRGFGSAGHRFVFSKAAGAAWMPSPLAGFECRDTGIAAATDGLAGVRVLRPTGRADAVTTSHDGEFLFHFVLDGEVTLQRDGDAPTRLGDGDSFVVPAAVQFTLSDASPDLQLLDVRLPAAS
jgi:mannose-6-phosphate isomerase-like protein (cupin superfamily)